MEGYKPPQLTVFCGWGAGTEKLSLFRQQKALQLSLHFTPLHATTCSFLSSTDMHTPVCTFVSTTYGQDEFSADRVFNLSSSYIHIWVVIYSSGALTHTDAHSSSGEIQLEIMPVVGSVWINGRIIMMEQNEFSGETKWHLDMHTSLTGMELVHWVMTQAIINVKFTVTALLLIHTISSTLFLQHVFVILVFDPLFGLCFI